MKKEGSPIKIKDFFTNPIHRIKQPAFVEIGFTQSTLNTFVKSFTNRYNNRYISFTAVREFIKSFTNNSPKLIQNYELFFKKNFTLTEDGNILLEQFVEFFMKEEGQGLDDFDQKAQKGLFKDLGVLSVASILKQCEELGVAMTEKEAVKMVQMLNYDAKVGNASAIKEQAFLKALKESTTMQA